MVKSIRLRVHPQSPYVVEPSLCARERCVTHRRFSSVARCSSPSGGSACLQEGAVGKGFHTVHLSQRVPVPRSFGSADLECQTSLKDPRSSRFQRWAERASRKTGTGTSCVSLSPLISKGSRSCSRFAECWRRRHLMRLQMLRALSFSASLALTRCSPWFRMTD